ncbi:MAG: Transcriptional regulator of heat shock protein [Candidatus Falkowbacteria bacterium GW2011_GWA2_39_24]|uniref:Transcriptional regulator of heat shock protein n=1 Tax=Candidatus Falkowbacteria bacterium GW2011_GWA2_39_24 TaxID=1618634 RepID=A0A0G0QWB1_9BACT|nr:MAG: Transcriptional regulator of heat shock protein [Candidatus Falkowbacteria bacterium GW2011_GWA2_39_24]
MNSRQEDILQALIEQYISSGSPVSSGLIAQQAGLNVSSATVRNEFAALEEDDYIQQPHTSAGRLPTEKAYHWYITRLNNRPIDNQVNTDLVEWFDHLGITEFKQVAKQLAGLTNLAVFWQHGDDVYCTGLTNLWQQPEYNQHQVLCDLSATIDRLDEIINQIFVDLPSTTQVLLGAESPFGRTASVIITKYDSDQGSGVIGILGPWRMDYDRNLRIIKYINNKLSYGQKKR